MSFVPALLGWWSPPCRVTHVRDVNAAMNLKHVAVSSTVSACGEERGRWLSSQDSSETSLDEAGSKQ